MAERDALLAEKDKQIATLQQVIDRMVASQANGDIEKAEVSP